MAITEVASKAPWVKRKFGLYQRGHTGASRCVDTLNAALEKRKTSAIITRDEEINRFIVRIADEVSGEIVREIPSEAILKFSRNLQELKGLIFDESL